MKTVFLLLALGWVSSVLSSSAPSIDYTKINKHIPPVCIDDRGIVRTTGDDCQKRFLLFKKQVPWIDGHKNCLTEGKQLASIMNRYEQNALEETMLMEGMGEVPMWIGATDEREEGTYRWIGEEFKKMQYKNWALGEPNDLNRKEHCAEIRFRYRWNDEDCQSRRGYVCEYYGPEQST